MSQRFRIPFTGLGPAGPIGPRGFQGDVGAPGGMGAVDTTDNFGIGSNALGSLSSGLCNVAVGPYALTSITTGSNNVAVGKNALSTIDTYNENVALGTDALASMTVGNQNVAIGYKTMESVTNGSYRNLAIGWKSMYNATNPGDNNIAIGGLGFYSAAFTGIYNVGIGGFVGEQMTSGHRNVAVGHGSLGYVTSGNNNTALGFAALSLNASSANTAVGSYALVSNTTGINNVAVGYKALNDCDDGGSNTALGYYALLSVTSGFSNTAIGNQALYNLTTNGDNVAIGSNAAANLTGSNNVAVGSFCIANGTAAGGFNTAIGYLALADVTGGSNTALGFAAGNDISTGDNNVLVGAYAGRYGSSVSTMVAVGVNALRNCNANENVAIGFEAGVEITTGTGNTIVGHSADVGLGASGTSGCVILGKDASSSEDNQFVVATGSTNKLRTTFGESTVSGVDVWDVEINGMSRQIPLEVAEGVFTNGSGFHAIEPTLGSHDASGDFSTILGGTGGIASGNYALSFGGSAIGDHGIALGQGSVASADQSISIGQNAGQHHTSGQLRNISIGHESGLANANGLTGDDNVMIGYNARTLRGDANNSVIIGNNAYTKAGGSVVIGYSSYSNPGGLGAAVAIGLNNHNRGIDSVSIGNNNVLGGSFTVGIGYSISTNTQNSVIIGNNAHAQNNAFHAVAIGTDTVAGNSIADDYCVAIGYSAFCGEYSGVSIGHSTSTTGKYGVSIGHGSNVTQEKSLAIGKSASVTGRESVAIGSNTTSSHNYCVVLGASGASDAHDQFVVAVGGSNKLLTTFNEDTVNGVDVWDVEINGVSRQIPLEVVSGGTGTFDNLDVAQDAFIHGKLTVDGLIDPTGLVLDGQISNPSNNENDKGVLWVTTGESQLMFTNQTGEDYCVTRPNTSETINASQFTSASPSSSVGTTFISTFVWDETQAFQSSDIAAVDRFGQAVDVSKNGNYLAVAAPAKTVSSSSDVGRIYIYTRSGTDWVFQDDFIGNAAQSGDRLGESLSITNDGEYCIAGLRPEDEAQVFIRSGSTWFHATTLVGSDTVLGDGFGVHVDISSDTNYAIVGAELKDSITGAAYTFRRTGATTWVEEAILEASDKATGDRLGRSVAISGDGQYALAGAYQKGVGAAYVFLRTGTSWAQQQKLTPSDSPNDFGWSCDISEDGTYAVIGANANQTGDGKAYVFKRVGTTWTQQQILTGSTSVTGDNFGYHVSIDETNTYIAVGADDSNFGGNNGEGRVYVFKRSGETWTEQRALTGSDQTTGDEFGHHVCIRNGILVVGANNFGSNRQGKVYSFLLGEEALGTMDDGTGGIEFKYLIGNDLPIPYILNTTTQTTVCDKRGNTISEITFATGAAVFNQFVWNGTEGKWYVLDDGPTGIFEDLTVNGDTYISGKLTVDGMIDPTALVLDAQSEAPQGSTGTNKGTLWVDDSTPCNLRFTDNLGTDNIMALASAIPFVESSSYDATWANVSGFSGGDGTKTLQYLRISNWFIISGFISGVSFSTGDNRATLTVPSGFPVASNTANGICSSDHMRNGSSDTVGIVIHNNSTSVYVIFNGMDTAGAASMRVAFLYKTSA